MSKLPPSETKVRRERHKVPEKLELELLERLGKYLVALGWEPLVISSDSIRALPGGFQFELVFKFIGKPKAKTDSPPRGKST